MDLQITTNLHLVPLMVVPPIFIRLQRLQITPRRLRYHRHHFLPIRHQILSLARL